MPKRKRQSPSPSHSDENSSADRLLKRQRKLCTDRIATAQKELVSALRLGAGFERQKYSRRKKTAKDKKDEKGVARLDAEYAVLKSLDITQIAEQHLRKTLAKVKSIKDHEGLPESAKQAARGITDTATLNVTARLYKVQGVKAAVDGCIDDLKGILATGSEGQNVGKKKKEDKKDVQKKRNTEEEEEGEFQGFSDDEEYDEEEAFAEFDARIAAPSSGEEDSDESLSDGHRPPSVVNSESEDEELGEESEDEFSDDSGAIPRTSQFVNGEDDSEEFSGSSSEDISEDGAIPPPKAKTKAELGKTTKSTALPSLSHAAYFSGSESEASDLDIDPAPKKNRRGQRARQKIWEQKYGEKAKHKEKEERNQGWDAKRGAVSNDRGRGKGGPKKGYGPERSGGNDTELGSRKKITKRDDSGALHPSWQAAKAAKEKKMAVKPQGTKITFD
jgi:hypothetical protein